MLELIDVLRRAIGAPVSIELAAAGHLDPADRFADTALIERVFGWRPKHDLDAIVRSAWAWHRRQAWT